MDVKLKRTFAIIGHANCGKTSLSESILFTCGATTRKGDVMQGNTVSDYQDDEKERSISINASFLNCNFKNHKFQIADTPGYMDFIGEPLGVLRAVDGVILVVDALDSVGVVTEELWQRLDKLQLPRIIFITKIDKSEAHPEGTLKDIQEQLSKNAVVIDKKSSSLVESVAETDDALLEKYLETGELSEDEVSGALRKAVLSAKIFPVFYGDALSDKGVKELLDAVITYLPSPVDHAPFNVKDLALNEEKTMAPSEDGVFAGYIFKTIFDPHMGQLSLMRVIRGKVSSNVNVYNITHSSKEHIGTINILQGKDQSPVNDASCGDIVALTKLKNAHTSDTLVDEKEKIMFAKTDFPAPSISSSIKPKTRADEEKISNALFRLSEEDCTFKISRNEETKELIVSGIGDLHLKVLLERMKTRYNVDVEMGTPKVSYRETITRKAKGRYKHKKQSGGHGQYGEVEFEIEPLPKDGEPYEFVNKIFGGAIPRNYIPSVEKGALKTISEGVLAGYHIDHIRVIVTDGTYHDVDSSDMAFQIAAANALKEAIKAAGPILLEPIMEVSIVVPDDFIGQISGDLSSRRGRIMGTEAKGKKEVIKAHVPLGEMFSYANDLRSMTGGRGSYSMKMSHYEQAPSKIAENVIAQKATAKTAEH